MVILRLLCRSLGCVPVLTKTAYLLLTALSVPERYCLGIGNINSCFYMRAINLG